MGEETGGGVRSASPALARPAGCTFTVLRPTLPSWPNDHRRAMALRAFAALQNKDTAGSLNGLFSLSKQSASCKPHSAIKCR
jgi:hypothetical protein